MKVGIIGRTRWLLDTARLAFERGHDISFVCTAAAAPEATAGVDDFSSFAREVDAPFFSTPRVSELDLNADVCLSVNWVNVLRQPFIDRFVHGVFNAHPGDLPRYRGNACLNWAILQGEPEAVLTIHRMVEELDAGPIALKYRRPINPEDDIGTLYSWLGEVIPRGLIAALDACADGSLELTPQDPTVRPLRGYPRKPQDSVIDWRQSAEDILRLVRASTRPFGGARTALESGREIIIHRARLHTPDHDFLAAPGQVCFALAGNPVIATGSGMLELVELEDDTAAKASVLASLRNRLV